MSDAGRRDPAVHVRLLGALLGQAGTATPEQVAGRAGVSAEAAAETLAALEREGLLERMPGEAYRATRLDSREVRELYPAVLMLEAIAVLRPARRALMPYERVYMDTGERRERSAAQHDAIVAALAGGDQAAAAELVRGNFTSALPELTAELDRHREEPRS